MLLTTQGIKLIVGEVQDVIIKNPFSLQMSDCLNAAVSYLFVVCLFLKLVVSLLPTQNDMKN